MRFVTVLDQNKCPKKDEITDFTPQCTPISEIPSNISTMMTAVKGEGSATFGKYLLHYFAPTIKSIKSCNIFIVYLLTI